MKSFFTKLQNLPEQKRKIILWSTIIIIGIILFVFYAKNINQKIKNFPRQEFIEKLKIPSLGKEIKNISNPELEEKLKELEKNFKQEESK